MNRKTMLRGRNYLEIIAIASLILKTSLSNGQISITADTISFDCRDSYGMRSKQEKFVISSQDDYDRSEFLNAGDGCLPFADIDFEKNILVGYRYRGSNCDRGIRWSTVEERRDVYLIQFATSPQVCRDFSFRIAWFVLERPTKKYFEITFERVVNKQGQG